MVFRLIRINSRPQIFSTVLTFPDVFHVYMYNFVHSYSS